ncbi:hypothetical protein Q8F55_008391 [Vanrija albida]|uniref:Uncharacterized protein n=1 Tax=Vanrija albida TaxID=181172 RepID=A0ABR3PWB5_9TREE
MNTCSFTYNTSIVQTCCTTANMSISEGSTLVHCGVKDDELEGFGRCLANNGVYRQLCTTNSRTAVKESSSPRKTPLGPLPLLLLALAFLAVVVNAEGLPPRRFHPVPRASPLQTRPNCTRFDMEKDQTKWLTNATTVRMIVSDKVNCAAGAGPCAVDVNRQAVFNVEFHPPSNASAGGIDPGYIVKAAGGSYNASATSTTGKGFFLPPGQSGYVEAWVIAASIPGVFRDCGDKNEYEGSVIVPDAARVARVVQFE